MQGEFVVVQAHEADDAFRRLLLGRIPDAHRLAACILRDPVAAEDAVQDAALQAWKRRHQLRDAAAWEVWFTRIVVNVCRDELRRRVRRPSLPLIDASVLEASGSDADRVADRLAERDAIDRVISRLTPDEQLVLVLRFKRDLTVPAISACTGLPEGTVKSRLHHAQEHLRAAFEAERRAELHAEEAV